MAVDYLDTCVDQMNAQQAKTQSGEGLQKLTWIKSRSNLGSTLLPRREDCLLMPNNPVPIGAVVMVIAASQKGAISHTTGHKVVVRGPVDPQRGKGMAKARDVEKEKGKVKAKGKEDEAGHKDLQQWSSRRKR